MYLIGIGNDLWTLSPSLIEEEENFSSVQASEINKYDSQIVQNEITITKIKLPYTQKVIMSTNFC